MDCEWIGKGTNKCIANGLLNGVVNGLANGLVNVL